MSVPGRLESHLSHPSSRCLRHFLTGLWVASVVGVLGSTAYMAITGGVDVPHVLEHRGVGDYLLPAGLSFVAQYVDASLGMGYGTTLSALLIMLGFPAQQVVIAVLLQQLVGGGIASAFHHAFGNADLRPDRQHFRLAMLLGGLGVVGSFVAATVAVSIPERLLDSAIGAVILTMGVVIFIARYVHLRFSWWRAGVLGLIAGANKGFMGGGYGPLIVAGQIAIGDTMRQAIAVVALSEALSCVGGIVGYALMAAPMPWALAGALVAGGLFSSFFAAATVRAIPAGGLKSVVAAVYLLLGGLTMYASLA
ncbi:MAG: sulfite exporter TauE/SafE family protein [Armatimonadota bacterium]